MLHFLIEVGQYAQEAAIRDSLGGAIQRIDALNSQPIQSIEVSGVGVLAWVAHSAEVLAPARPVAESLEGVTLYAGLPLSTDGEGSASNASNLGSELRQEATHLEGAFVLARANVAVRRFEIVNDFLGFCQLYQAECSGRRIFSTSVNAIANRLAPSDIDAHAAAEYCISGWVMGDRTLHPAVTVVPPATSIVIDNRGRITRDQYYAAEELLRRKPKRPLDDGRIDELRRALEAIIRSASRSAKELFCPVTAGRDSRLLVGLTMSAGIKAKYFTTQTETSPDVVLGRQIANKYKLDYELRETPATRIAAEYDHLVSQLDAQTDGLRAIDAIRYLAAQPDVPESVPALLNGHGGEVCRGYYATTSGLMPGATLSRILSATAYRINSCRRDHFLLPSAVAHLRNHLESQAQKWLAMGFHPIDVPDLFYAYDRVRRWAGTHRRVFESAHSVVAPLVSRPFFEASFAHSARARCTEPLHFRLLANIDVDLHGMPFEKGTWPHQNPTLRFAERLLKRPVTFLFRTRNRRRQTTRPAGTVHKTVSGWINDLHATILDSRLEDIRQFNLDQTSSPVWGFVDRRAFDTLTRRSEDCAQRRKIAASILAVNSVNYYRQFSLSTGLGGLP